MDSIDECKETQYLDDNGFVGKCPICSDYISMGEEVELETAEVVHRECLNQEV